MERTTGDRMNEKTNVLPNGLHYVLERLNSQDHRLRELSADQLTDFVQYLGHLAPAVAGVLVMVYLVETEKAAAVSQLNALGDICEWNKIPVAVTEPVTDRLVNNTCEEWEREYNEAIVEAFTWHNEE